MQHGSALVKSASFSSAEKSKSLGFFGGFFCCYLRGPLLGWVMRCSVMRCNEDFCQKINEAWLELHEAPTLYISYFQAMEYKTEQL